MDFHALAEWIAAKEGKKEQVSIAQIKEILSIVLRILAQTEKGELERLLSRYR